MDDYMEPALRHFEDWKMDNVEEFLEMLYVLRSNGGVTKWYGKASKSGKFLVKPLHSTLESEAKYVSLER